MGAYKGKTGIGAAGKVAVFGLLMRQGNVFTVVVENNVKSEMLLPVITRKIERNSWVYTDTYRGYNALDDEFHHE